MGFNDPAITKVFEWVRIKTPYDFLSDTEYCATRDIFQARLERMSRELEKTILFEKNYSLVTAIAGELGNNAFDHNLGSWPDIPGIYFSYDMLKHFFVIADRGQGIFATLQRIRPALKDDREALTIAFTEAVSGRAPEKRGNGLKFVDAVVKQEKFTFFLQSGSDIYQIKNGLSTYAHGEEKIAGVITACFY